MLFQCVLNSQKIKAFKNISNSLACREFQTLTSYVWPYRTYYEASTSIKYWLYTEIFSITCHYYRNIGNQTAIIFPILVLY